MMVCACKHECLCVCLKEFFSRGKMYDCCTNLSCRTENGIFEYKVELHVRVYICLGVQNQKHYYSGLRRSLQCTYTNIPVTERARVCVCVQN